MRVAKPIELTLESRLWLEQTAQSALTPRRLMERCRIVLLAAEGKRNEEIVAALGFSPNKVTRWRTRFADSGRSGIEHDEPGRGRKPDYSPEVRKLIVGKTTRGTPPGQTHWSRSTMAKATGVSPSTVGRIWREHGLKPHLIRTFKVSNDRGLPRRWLILSGSILMHPSTPSSCAVMKRARCKPWIAPSPGCRSRRDGPAR